MRFLTALSIGLLASQARVADAIKAYTLTSSLTCTSGPDAVHFDFALGGLDVPPNFPGTDIYEVAYYLTYKQNDGIVSVPVSAVAAKDGTGRSEIQNNAFTATNKDNLGAQFTGAAIYELPGTILHHQQVNGVSGVTGYFEIDSVSANIKQITCDTTTSTPNIQLTPLQYTINGIKNLVINSYSIVTSNYTAIVGGGTTAANPVYSFDIQPFVNIDPCYTDSNTGNTRVPFRLTNLAVTGPTEKGIVSLVVTDGQGEVVTSWFFGPDGGMQVGTATLDVGGEPSMFQAIQTSNNLAATSLANPPYIYGRIDFAGNDPIGTCDNLGRTNITIAVVDYSTTDTVTGVQTWHFIPGAANDGLNPAAQIPADPNQLTILAAGATPAPPKPPSSAQKKARHSCAKAAAKKAAAKKAADAAAAAAAAAAAGQDAAHPCLLTVPANPLTALGLSTPYILGGGCTIADTASFVEASIISPATGQVSHYAPLVVQQDPNVKNAVKGLPPAIQPVIPTLPADAVVCLHFGSNAVFQQLVAPAGAPNTLTQANCVNGAMIGGKLSAFGQVAACNCAAFYQAAAIAVFQNLLAVPPLGTAIDLQPCPTTRSFFHVDQDPQDNLNTAYLLTADGKTALSTPGNLASLTATAKANKMTPPTVVGNPGDNPLLNQFVNPTMKCNSWMVPSLSNPGAMSGTNAMNEVHAAFKQGSPVARIPALDPMTLDNNGNANLVKLNAYRTGLAGQNPVKSLGQASTSTFCKNMVGTQGAVRLLGNQKVLSNAAGPVAGQNLFQFLQQRFAAAVGPANLMCGKLVPGLTNPLAGGAVIAAQSAFTVQDALLVGAASPDNAALDPFAELQGQPQPTPNTTGSAAGNAFPIAIVAGAVGGVIAFLVASIIIFKVVQRRKTNNVMATTARECKV